ncbi:uncharacterized protein LOC142560409 isoform X2 [Dermacentor variabilis]|uniref:uncharacterized protein LOC142560409 isoform X2 n=1 Tax=Dermacentor variabilis TaxID=34621 RepID=UPI003F5B51E2
MDPFIESFVEFICFSFLLNQACAFDNEFEEKWRRIHTPPRLPPGMIFIIVVVLMVAAIWVILCCCWVRRKDSMRHASPHIPPPLAPAPAPVTSGARTRASPEVYPVVPGETRSPAVSYPQPAYYPHPTAPYPQGLPYMGSNMVPLVQPSAAPLTSLSSPFDPPPPYVNQTIPPETHFRTS